MDHKAVKCNRNIGFFTKKNKTHGHKIINKSTSRN